MKASLDNLKAKVNFYSTERYYDLDTLLMKLDYAKNFAQHKIAYYEQLIKEYKEKHNIN